MPYHLIKFFKHLINYWMNKGMCKQFPKENTHAACGFTVTSSPFSCHFGMLTRTRLPAGCRVQNMDSKPSQWSLLTAARIKLMTGQWSNQFPFHLGLRSMIWRAAPISVENSTGKSWDSRWTMVFEQCGSRGTGFDATRHLDEIMKIFALPRKRTGELWCMGANDPNLLGTNHLPALENGVFVSFEC